MNAWRYGALLAVLATALPACSGDDDDSSKGSAIDLGAPNPNGTPGDAQTPPTTNGSDVETWLTNGDYKSWHCEMASHPQMKVSPHGQNLICSNDLEASFSGTGERPKGSAAVKELYDDSNALVGYAVEVKTQAMSASGGGWYWYERVPLTSPVPHNSGGIVADGLGTKGQAQSICVGCHGGAGSNVDHTVLASSDFVYDQVGP